MTVSRGIGRPPDRDHPLGAPLVEELRALAYVGQELTSSKSLADGFRSAMRLLDDRLGAKHSVLFVSDARRRSIATEAAYGASPEDFCPRYGQGVSGRVAEAGRPIVVPEVHRDPMALSELTEPERWRGEPLSLVSVPVSIGGRCAGALSAYFRAGSPEGFSTRLGVLQVVASVVAQGLRMSEPGDENGSGGEPRAVFEYANMIGNCAAMRQVYEEIGQVARTSATALILGESGTGKELVAQAIHANSDRAGQPFITINGAAFPEALFESELFGHERGAFTGALGRKKGRLDLAQGGTLFLDEIGELPLSTQVKLLRVLQTREFERLGGTETLRADVRLIAATNKDMARAVAQGSFREDLYYRLNVFTIALPPLRDRVSDLSALAEYFLAKYAREHRRKVRHIASSAMDMLCEYGWPGNVRELENAVERSVVVCDGHVVEERHLPKSVRTKSAGQAERKRSLGEAVEHLERTMIEEALQESKGNLARASRALGTTERILRYKVEKYDLGSLRSEHAKR